MQTEEFVRRVCEQLQTDDEETAAAAVVATLAALGQVLDEEDAGDLAAQLPAELAASLRAAMRQEDAHTLEGFVGRVGELAGAEEDDAECYAAAVLGVLAEAVSFGAWGNLVADLPDALADRTAASRDATF